MSFSSRSSNPSPSEQFQAHWFETMFWFNERATDVIMASDQLIQKEYASIKNGIDEWDEKNPNHDYSGFDIHASDLFMASRLEKDLPPALFIQQYGQFERLFDAVCVEAGVLFNVSLRPADLSDKGIHRSRKFVTKVLSVNLDSLNEQWLLLQQYSTVRGVIAHGEMEIPENKLNNLGHLVKSGMVTCHGDITVNTKNIGNFVRTANYYLGSVVEFIGEKHRTLG